MNYVVIVPASKIIGRGWDMLNCKVLIFRNLKKLFYFARYYSRVHDVLIKVYIDHDWESTYCKGKEIWNCY